ncbi:hypothetical protein Hanom_Chr07g00617921 [Helianthus anomalus]
MGRLRCRTDYRLFSTNIFRSTYTNGGSSEGNPRLMKEAAVIPTQTASMVWIPYDTSSVPAMFDSDQKSLLNQLSLEAEIKNFGLNSGKFSPTLVFHIFLLGKKLCFSFIFHPTCFVF